MGPWTKPRPVNKTFSCFGQEACLGYTLWKLMQQEHVLGVQVRGAATRNIRNVAVLCFAVTT